MQRWRYHSRIHQRLGHELAEEFEFLANFGDDVRFGSAAKRGWVETTAVINILGYRHVCI